MSVKAKQAAKQKIAALSYSELIEKHQSIQSRLGVIQIENGDNDENTAASAAAIVAELNGNGSNVGVGSNAGVGVGAGADCTTKMNTGGGKRGRRRKRSPTPTAAAAAAVPNTIASAIANNANHATTGQPINENNTHIPTPTTTTTTTTKIPYNIKTDVQWDYLLAEMKWLSTDFQSERKRQISLAKKQSSSIKSYTKTKEKRKTKQLVTIELNKRKLSHRLAKDVCNKWWNDKICRIIAYKQKVDSELVKKRSMDRHLILLVKQTERYSNLLTTDVNNSSGNGNGNGNRNNSMSIEDALTQAEQKVATMIQNNNHDNDNDNDNHDNVNDNDNNNNNVMKRKRRKRKIRFQNDNLKQIHETNDNETNDQDNDQEFIIHQYEQDDETTIEAEEKLGKEMSNEEEIDLLTKENEMSIDELKALYYGSGSGSGNSVGNIVGGDDNNNGDDDGDSNDNDNNNNNNDDNEVMDEKISSNDDIMVTHTHTRSRSRRACSVLHKQNTSTISDMNGSKNDESNANGTNGANDIKNGVNGSLSNALLSNDSKNEISQINDLNDPVISTADDNVTTNATVSITTTATTKSTTATTATTATATITNTVQPLSKETNNNEQNKNNNNDEPTLNGIKKKDEVETIKIEDEEFKPTIGADLDDETTIEAEEKLGKEMSNEEEIDLLTKENEMSIDELKALYYGASSSSSSAAATIRTTSSATATATATATAAVENGEISENGTNDHDKNDDVNHVDNPIDLSKLDNKDDNSSMKVTSKESKVSASLSSSIPSATSAISPSKNEAEILNPTITATIDPFLVNDDSQEDEFKPTIGTKDDVDDETTIEAEERLGRDMSYDDEIALLKKENEMPIEDLRSMYLGSATDNTTHTASCENSSDKDHHIGDETSYVNHEFDNGDVSDATSIISNHGDSEEEEFTPTNGNDVDDETTIEAEERLGRDMSYNDEINLLKQENEMSVEELRAMYLNMDGEEPNDDHDDNKKNKRKKAIPDDENDSIDHNRKRVRLDKEDPDDEATLAMRSLELADAKARNTAVSRPFLLASWVKLRAYQQIGLNWLVSTQTRRLNAILADEMGLGKTLQTISLLSYLACYKGIWGPHLIIVPTSCIVNWEMELKRFTPGLKVLCYYGSAKRRKELRQGWTKANWHHVVITSYQIVVQDSFAFKRKKWYYLILDEAHNIKNFQSQRWQTLINFNTQRRLLLTGTPLQNNLMELWSLLHFLMPYIFRSRKEFSQWFSNPMNNIIEGNANRNDDLINRLHGIIRPFVLRRLKKDVEKQMPGKYEHIVKCHLSRRQMFLYEEFMARSSTRMALQKGGNYMGMMNVLMQLRKVCNHPDLFEPRSIITPFFSERLSIVTAGCVAEATNVTSPFDRVSPYLMYPIWSLGSGMPSLHNSLKHDGAISVRIKKLQPSSQELLSGFDDTNIEEERGTDEIKPGLRRLLNSIWSDSKTEKTHAAKVQARINSLRCEGDCFLLPESTLQAVEMQPKIPSECKYDDMTQIRIASTPRELLGMKKSQEERERDLDFMLNKFLFYVPNAGSRAPMMYAKRIDPKIIISEDSPSSLSLMKEVETKLHSTKKTNAPFFPDKKLVQFDAGKLQTLAELLRSRKQGNHRVLIFTQMSKMLDILEIFLNLNGHTYLRLDGSTGVEQRQRLMDRFNNDEKMFCFILSTRSGGLGINLTGADTVVFYDSDWNPAMDAQAQDRAHRIGQTRDVHIYRLVTEHTIEENILVKAKQKRHLDFLVMDEGKFHTDDQAPEATVATNEEENDTDIDVTTKGGLRSILGLESDDTEPVPLVNEVKKEADGEMSKEEMELAMAKLEDEDDVLAMRGAQKEAAEELQEFDDNIKLKTDDADNDGDESNDSKENGGSPDKKPNGVPNVEVESEEAKLEKEFEDWKRQVGADKASIDASLNPVERYALRFREEIDPFYSMWYLSEQQRIEQAELLEENEIDIEEIENMKAEGEQNAIADGDLLATLPPTTDLPSQRNLYYKERSKMRANKKRRKLTGENWISKIDGKTQFPFWYNSDTGEAVWDKPKILLELHEEEVAQQHRWNAVPIKPLITIMQFLVPHPYRMVCASVCRQWRRAAQDISFVRHVYPVEMGALTMDPKKMESNHYRTISEALLEALPGDTIELGDGHYWLNDPELVVHCPLRIIGDEKDPSHVVIEVSGSIIWDCRSGYIEGITLRRPRIASSGNSGSGSQGGLSDVLQIGIGGKVIMAQCAIEGNVGGGNKEVLSNNNSSCLNGNGIVVKDNGHLIMIESQVCNNQGAGILHTGSGRAMIKMDRSTISGNRGPGIALHGHSVMEASNCHIVDNFAGSIQDMRKKQQESSTTGVVAE